MAVDLGGPINKAAYISVQEHGASVATGGSVCNGSSTCRWYGSPLATTVAVLFFKNKFTKEERQSGLTNMLWDL